MSHWVPKPPEKFGQQVDIPQVFWLSNGAGSLGSRRRSAGIILLATHSQGSAKQHIHSDSPKHGCESSGIPVEKDLLGLD